MPRDDSPQARAEAVLAKKRRYLIPCVYHFYRDPPVMVRGEGVHLVDSAGRRYLDLYAGVSVHALGHCHPELADAICRQVKTLQHTTTIYLTEPIVDLAEALAEVLPGDLTRSFFCASGSEANEGAALLATLATGRSGLLALENGLHGRTKLGMSLTGLEMWRTDPRPVPDVRLVPAPTCGRCPFSQQYGSCKMECVAAVEQAIAGSPSGAPAAMFVEPIQGNGGIQVPPSEYFPRLRSVLDRHGVLLVADEVQTGFGRTGTMFALSRWGVEPDILTGGKALGGGTPIGFFSTTDRMAAAYTRPGASTFGGNPVTAAAGLAFLRILKRDNLVERAARLGKVLKDRLSDLASRYPMIEDVRGAGLMIGVEIGGGPDEAAKITDEVLERMKDAGYLLGKTGPGRNVLTFMPPLVIEEAELEGAVDALEKTLGQL